MVTCNRIHFKIPMQPLPVQARWYRAAAVIPETNTIVFYGGGSPSVNLMSDIVIFDMINTIWVGSLDPATDGYYMPTLTGTSSPTDTSTKPAAALDGRTITSLIIGCIVVITVLERTAADAASYKVEDIHPAFRRRLSYLSNVQLITSEATR
ncbi:hypothetical protein BC939DRAFT_171930 [Gamsiella multidivaricata]|uniref:uncharacterized protein n=1 Tax=Gamsiella multidivaricata TaxID=101098 RepID=UPI00222023E5|nr:uncharacterized protein BC939DRAFT_171930 [Gamsiella multidivaricata]KAI7822843.1 hypothetical protein BC939DRAFT_171930 [Gamsiella multidivaricata]